MSFWFFICVQKILSNPIILSILTQTAQLLGVACLPFNLFVATNNVETKNLFLAKLDNSYFTILICSRNYQVVRLKLILKNRIDTKIAVVVFNCFRRIITLKSYRVRQQVHRHSFRANSIIKCCPEHSKNRSNLQIDLCLLFGPARYQPNQLQFQLCAFSLHAQLTPLRCVVRLEIVVVFSNNCSSFVHLYFLSKV